MAENIQELILEMKGLQTDPTPYMRAVVLVLAGEVRQRIHVRGEKADGKQIGTYSTAYLRVREKNNRGNDRKKILSLTRQMEQDFVPVSEGNQYGLGFNNQHNMDKATWQEEANPGTYDLSQQEIDLAETTITDYLNGLFG